MQTLTPKQLADKIPEISDAEMAFPAGKNIDSTYEQLTPIARQWVEDGHDSWGPRFFGMVFYGHTVDGKKAEKGTPVPQKNLELEDVTEEDITRVLRWLRAGMSSYGPKHEDKEAVCSMLWQTFFLPPEGLA